MIRRAIIILLTLAALGTAVVWLDSLRARTTREELEARARRLGEVCESHVLKACPACPLEGDGAGNYPGSEAEACEEYERALHDWAYGSLSGCDGRWRELRVGDYMVSVRLLRRLIPASTVVRRRATSDIQPEPGRVEVACFVPWDTYQSVGPARSVSFAGLGARWGVRLSEISPMRPQVLLYCPLWMLALVFATYPAIAFIRRPLRRWRRHRKGLCMRCSYDLTGNVSGVCPECGTPTHAATGGKA